MLHFASHTGLSPSMVTFSKVFCSRFAYNVAVLQPRWRLATSTVWAVPRSLATTGESPLALGADERRDKLR